jgi:cation diffusion facilitator CzcD-associated flavoprotein CzcO
MDESVLIIGAGPGGIAAALELDRAGQGDYVIHERSSAVGGTWHQNRYPGVACDVPGHYYCYSSRPNVDPKRLFATGPELLGYFAGVARDSGVESHVRFDSAITQLDWIGDHWLATASSGVRTRHRVVIGAVGRLNKPRIPDIPGLDGFAGVVRHSAEWDETIDLAGRRVGVVGSGSSATQIVSAIVDTAQSVDVFQRTPHWVMPMENPPIPEEIRAALRASPEAAREQYRAVEAVVTRIAEAGIHPDSPGAAERDAAVRAGLDRIEDPDLRRLLTPDYAIGCKRILVSATYLDAVQRSHVTVIPGPIEKVGPTGVRLADGTWRTLDVIILATGFHADNFLRPIRVRGTGGITLDDLWADSFVSYKSVALPHMPNLFLVNGPFTPRREHVGPCRHRAPGRVRGAADQPGADAW